jgi:hypothetical protein
MSDWSSKVAPLEQRPFQQWLRRRKKQQARTGRRRKQRNQLLRGNQRAVHGERTQIETALQNLWTTTNCKFTLNYNFGADGNEGEFMSTTSTGSADANRPQLPSGRYYRGVTKVGSKWQAQIASCGVNRYLGRFDTVQAAARAYDLAAREFDGNNTRCNYKNEQEVAEDAKGEIHSNEGPAEEEEEADEGNDASLDVACNGENQRLMAQEVAIPDLHNLLKSTGAKQESNSDIGVGHQANAQKYLVTAHVQQYVETYFRMGLELDKISSEHIQRQLEEVLHCDLAVHTQLISCVLQSEVAQKQAASQPKRELELNMKEHRKLVACVREYMHKSSRMGLEVDKMTGEEVQQQLEKILHCGFAAHRQLIQESTVCMQVCRFSEPYAISSALCSRRNGSK